MTLTITTLCIPCIINWLDRSMEENIDDFKYFDSLNSRYTSELNLLTGYITNMARKCKIVNVTHNASRVVIILSRQHSMIVLHAPTMNFRHQHIFKAKVTVSQVVE